MGPEEGCGGGRVGDVEPESADAWAERRGLDAEGENVGDAQRGLGVREG